MGSAGAGSAGNVIAAALSFFVPGLGQLTQGRGGAALAAFLLAVFLWAVSFGLLGWLVNIGAAIDAARYRG